MIAASGASAISEGARRELDLALRLTPGEQMRRQLTAWYGELTK